MNGIRCPKCDQKVVVQVESLDDGLTVHCEKCGDSEFMALEVPQEIIFKFVKRSVKEGCEHQNHAIGGMMARQHFIQTHDQEFPLDDYKVHIKYGDKMYEAADEFISEKSENINPLAVLSTMVTYMEELNERRDYQMALCKCIANLKRVEIPESCKQDFCEEKQEG